MQSPDLLYLVRDPWPWGPHAVPRVHYARRPRGEHRAVQCSCATPRESVMAYVANPPLEPRLLLHALAKNWWLLLLRGICAIVFGVLTFVWPGITLLTLVLLYGAYALVDGVLALAEAIMGGAPAPRWWLALVGLLGIAVGILTFA